MSNSKATHEFNGIRIIQSLPSDELQTGRGLSIFLNDLVNAKGIGVTLGFYTPVTAAEIRGILSEIHSEVKSGAVLPILHFECHGSPAGLHLESGEFLEWKEIRDFLIGINGACGVNLLIVMAACNGLHLIKCAMRLDRAPFWAVVGPEHEVTAGQIEVDFKRYYSILLDTLDGDEALRALNASVQFSRFRYHMLTAEGLFLKSYAKYIATWSSSRARTKRAEELLTQAMNNPDVAALGTRRARLLIKRELRKHDEPYFKRKRREFFFEDVFPENRGRFPLNFEMATRWAKDMSHWKSRGAG